MTALGLAARASGNGNGNEVLFGGIGEDVIVFHERDDNERVFGFLSSKGKTDRSSQELSGFDDFKHAIHRGVFGATIDLGNGDSLFPAGPLGVHVRYFGFAFWSRSAVQ